MCLRARRHLPMARLSATPSPDCGRPSQQLNASRPIEPKTFRLHEGWPQARHPQSRPQGRGPRCSTTPTPRNACGPGYARARFPPRAWQSTPAVKPGPTPTTMGAISMEVPRLRLANTASTTASGATSLTHAHAGSTRTGTTPSPESSPKAWETSCARTAVAPSTWAFPTRTASLKATVRRTVKGCSISVISTEAPHRTRRGAMAPAISPAPRITANIEDRPSKGFPPPPASRIAPRCAAPPASRQRSPPC